MTFNLNLVIALLLVLGTYFMRMEVALLAGVGLAGGIYFLKVLAGRSMDRIGLIVLLNYIYWLASGFVIGGLSPKDLIDPNFYQGDGRIFISYVPLLFFSVVSMRATDVMSLLRMVVILILVTFVLMVVWLAVQPGILTGGKAGVFLGFLTSHTGAGTFFGGLCVFVGVYGMVRKRQDFILLAVVALIAVFTTASRTALVGVLAVAVWYLWRNANVKVLWGSAIAALVLVTALPFVAPHTFARTTALFSWDTIENMRRTAALSTWNPGEERVIEGREFNVLSRVLFYVYAAERFVDSPIIGIGFGGYNDYNLNYTGVRGVVYVAASGDRRLTAGNAHNSILHMGAETGLVGIGLLGWLWGSLYLRMRAMARKYKDALPIRAYCLSCAGLVIFMMTVAQFGHALAAPSIGLLSLTLIGVALSYDRSVVKGPVLPDIIFPSRASRAKISRQASDHITASTERRQ